MNVLQPDIAQPCHDALLAYRPGERLAPKNVFDNTNPLEIEIGCGKGKFVIARSQEHPGINFLGIDIIWKWMKYGVRRAEKRALENLRFIRADVRNVVKYGLTSRSVSVFHVYFPDPWPKRRHRKRRIITGEFLTLLHDRLEQGGLIEMATDDHDYFDQMKRAVIQSGVAWKRSLDSTNDRIFGAVSKTNYELKYETAGRTLYYLELEK
jgi:tRNA (guanine-N7-)-methyltransferase